MAQQKNDPKKQAAETAPAAPPTEPVEAAAPPVTAEMVVETPAEAELVPDVPSTALTPSALTSLNMHTVSVESLEQALAQVESRIHELAEKYPQWADGLFDTVARYGQSNTSDAFDVSVGSPGTYIRLRHGMSQNVPKELRVNVGEFFTDEANLGESFEAMLVYVHDSRKYFLKGAELGAPECQSHDAKYGSRYGECDRCPYAQYNEEAKRSPCSRGYAAIIATPDFKVIGELGFHKISAAAGRKFIQNLKTMKGGHSMWTTEIKTAQVTSGGYTNAIPTGGIPKTRTTAEQREVLETLSKFFKLRAMTFSARGAQRRAARGLDAAPPAGALGSGKPESDVPLL